MRPVGPHAVAHVLVSRGFYRRDAAQRYPRMPVVAMRERALAARGRAPQFF